RTRRARPTRSATAPPTRTVIAVVLHRSSVTLSSTCPISAPRAAVSTRVSGARSWSMVVVDSSSSVVAARQMSTVPGATGFPSPVVVVVRAQSRTPTPVTSARGASPSRVSTSEGRASPAHTAPSLVAVTSTGSSTRLRTCWSRTTTRSPGSAVKVAAPEVPRAARNHPPRTTATRPSRARTAPVTRRMSVLTSVLSVGGGGRRHESDVPPWQSSPEVSNRSRPLGAVEEPGDAVDLLRDLTGAAGADVRLHHEADPVAVGPHRVDASLDHGHHLVPLPLDRREHRAEVEIGRAHV